MKIVRDPKDLEEEIISARREAAKSFGDDEVLLERWLERPRHVEVQVFADQTGGCVALWERDCSVQRRHQSEYRLKFRSCGKEIFKLIMVILEIIEEAPAPGLSVKLKRDFVQKAVAAAKAVN